MQPIYFVSFLLGETEGGGPTRAEVAKLIERWLFEGASRPDRPADFSLLKNQTLNFDGDISITTRSVELPPTGGLVDKIVGVRFEHPDADTRRKWRTDIVLSLESTSPDYRFSVTLQSGSANTAIWRAQG